MEFNIPTDPEKYVPSGTIPKNQDEKVHQIKFKSTGVLHQKKGKGLSLDDQSSLTISLGNKQFTIKSDVPLVPKRNYERDFLVVAYKYDEGAPSAKFELSNDLENVTHDLSISWHPSFDFYSLILKSRDDGEEFQFQDVKAIEKNEVKIANFPRIVDVKKLSNNFLIKKKKNSPLQGYWVNGDGRIYADFKEIKIAEELVNEIERNLANEERGNYFIGFNVEETIIEVSRGVFETKRKVVLSHFYKR